MTLYIPAFKSQHDSIHRGLENFRKFLQEGRQQECLEELRQTQSILLHHHEVERQILFEHLRPLPKMNQGGPFCSYFFEFFMNNRPLLAAEKMISKVRGQPVSLQVPKHLDIYFTSGSLLSVPIEEQLANEFLIEELIRVVESSSLVPNQNIQSLLDLLQDLIQANHQKEETCLWVSAGQALEPGECERLSKIKDFPNAG